MMRTTTNYLSRQLSARRLVLGRNPFSTVKTGLIFAGALGVLALFVFAWAYPTFPGDEGAIVRFQALRAGWLDSVALALARLGSFWVFAPVTAGLVGCLMLLRRRADAAMVVAAGMAIGAGNALKLVVERPRPEYHLIGEIPSNFSFPSGHALLAVIMGGVLVYLIGLWVKPLAPRRALQAGIILAVAVTGASRVYLGSTGPAMSSAPTPWARWRWWG